MQHILTIFFRSKFSFESFTILFLVVFIYRATATFQSCLFSKSCCFSNIVVQRVQRTELDSESFVNTYQLIRYLSIVFKKNNSVKDLFYPVCLSKCFGRNILILSNLLQIEILPERYECV